MNILSSRKIWTYFLLVSLFCNVFETIHWLGLSKYNRPDVHERRAFSEMECHFIRTNHGLQQRQTRFCLNQRQRFAMHGILRASKAAVYYCMKTFRDQRWNCSSAARLPNIGNDLQLGTQEQAVVHAFSSVALLFEISRRCAQNKITHCTCGESDQSLGSDLSQQRLMFAGCPDNVDVGIKYVKRFTGYHKLGRNQKKKPEKVSKFANNRSRKMKRINGHNYEAGIKIQLNNQRLHCKCHGVSGSCGQKVCYRQLRRLDDDVLLTILKQQYISAKYVDITPENKIFVTNLFDESNRISPRYISDTDLAFIEHSSDFCEPDKSVGSFGTHGRLCRVENISITATEHCSNMCCGRGFRTKFEQITNKCRCRIDENFKIQCDECVLKMKKFYCI